jgi:hypothetical protein
MKAHWGLSPKIPPSKRLKENLFNFLVRKLIKVQQKALKEIPTRNKANKKKNCFIKSKRKIPYI